MAESERELKITVSLNTEQFRRQMQSLSESVDQIFGKDAERKSGGAAAGLEKTDKAAKGAKRSIQEIIDLLRPVAQRTDDVGAGARALIESLETGLKPLGADLAQLFAEGQAGAAKLERTAANASLRPGKELASTIAETKNRYTALGQSISDNHRRVMQTIEQIGAKGSVATRQAFDNAEAAAKKSAENVAKQYDLLVLKKKELESARSGRGDMSAAQAGVTAQQERLNAAERQHLANLNALGIASTAYQNSARGVAAKNEIIRQGLEALGQEAVASRSRLVGMGDGITKTFERVRQSVANIGVAPERAVAVTFQNMTSAARRAYRDLQDAEKKFFDTRAAYIRGEATGQQVGAADRARTAASKTFTEALKNQSRAGDAVTASAKKMTDALNRNQEMMDKGRRAAYAYTIAGYQLQSTFGGITRTMNQSVNEFADFDFTVRRAAGAFGVFDQSSDAFDRLGNAIENTAVQTKLFDPKQIAQGYYYWGSTTGQLVKSQEDLLAIEKQVIPIMQMAAITQTDLETSLKGVYAIMQQYNMPIEKATETTQMLFLVAQKTAVEVPDLLEAFKMVGPIANELGISFQDVVGVLGSLGNAGIKGSMAGRALRQTFIKLTDPTVRASKALDQAVSRVYGLGKSFNDIVFPEGDFIGMQGYLDVLSNITKDLTQAERQRLLGIITTNNELPAMTKLVNANTAAHRANTAGVVDQANAMYNASKASDTFSGAVENQMNSFLAQQQQLANLLASIRIELGSAIAETLLPVMRTANEVLSSFLKVLQENKFVAKALGVGLLMLTGLTVQYASAILRATGSAKLLETLLKYDAGLVGNFGRKMFDASKSLDGLGGSVSRAARAIKAASIDRLLARMAPVKTRVVDFSVPIAQGLQRSAEKVRTPVLRAYSSLGTKVGIASAAAQSRAHSATLMANDFLADVYKRLRAKATGYAWALGTWSGMVQSDAHAKAIQATGWLADTWAKVAAKSAPAVAAAGRITGLIQTRSHGAAMRASGWMTQTWAKITAKMASMATAAGVFIGQAQTAGQSISMTAGEWMRDAWRAITIKMAPLSSATGVLLGRVQSAGMTASMTAIDWMTRLWKRVTLKMAPLVLAAGIQTGIWMQQGHDLAMRATAWMDTMWSAIAKRMAPIVAFVGEVTGAIQSRAHAAYMTASAWMSRMWTAIAKRMAGFAIAAGVATGVAQADAHSLSMRATGWMTKMWADITAKMVGMAATSGGMSGAAYSAAMAAATRRAAPKAAGAAVGPVAVPRVRVPIWQQGAAGAAGDAAEEVPKTLAGSLLALGRTVVTKVPEIVAAIAVAVYAFSAFSKMASIHSEKFKKLTSQVGKGMNVIGASLKAMGDFVVLFVNVWSLYGRIAGALFSPFWGVLLDILIAIGDAVRELAHFFRDLGNAGNKALSDITVGFDNLYKNLDPRIKSLIDLVAKMAAPPDVQVKQNVYDDMSEGMLRVVQNAQRTEILVKESAARTANSMVSSLARAFATGNDEVSQAGADLAVGYLNSFADRFETAQQPMIAELTDGIAALLNSKNGWANQVGVAAVREFGKAFDSGDMGEVAKGVNKMVGTFSKQISSKSPALAKAGADAFSTFLSSFKDMEGLTPEEFTALADSISKLANPKTAKAGYEAGVQFLKSLGLTVGAGLEQVAMLAGDTFSESANQSAAARAAFAKTALGKLLDSWKRQWEKEDKGGSGNTQTPLEKALEVAQQSADLADALRKIEGLNLKALINKTMGGVASAMALAMRITYRYAKTISKATLQKVADFSESVGALGSAITSMVDALDKAGSYKSVSSRSITTLLTNIRYVINAVHKDAKRYRSSVLAAAKEYAEVAGAIATGIGSAFEALSKVGEYKPISSTTLSNIAGDFKKIVSRFVATMRSSYSQAVTSAARDWATAAGEIATAIGSAIDVFVKLADGYTRVDSAVFGRIADDMALAVKEMVRAAKTVDKQLAAAAAEFAGSAGTVVGAIGTAIDSFTKLGQYVEPLPGVLESVVSTILTAVDLMLAKMKAAALTTDQVSSLSTFSEMVSSVVGAISGTYDALYRETEGIDNPRQLMDIPLVFTWMEQALAKMTDLTTKYSGAQVARIGALAETVAKIGDAIKSFFALGLDASQNPESLSALVAQALAEIGTTVDSFVANFSTAGASLVTNFIAGMASQETALQTQVNRMLAVTGQMDPASSFSVNNGAPTLTIVHVVEDPGGALKSASSETVAKLISGEQFLSNVKFAVKTQ